MADVINIREHMLRRIKWKSMSQDEWHKIIEEAKKPAWDTVGPIPLMFTRWKR